MNDKPRSFRPLEIPTHLAVVVLTRNPYLAEEIDQAIVDIVERKGGRLVYHTVDIALLWIKREGDP